MKAETIHTGTMEESSDQVPILLVRIPSSPPPTRPRQDPEEEEEDPEQISVMTDPNPARPVTSFSKVDPPEWRDLEKGDVERPLSVKPAKDGQIATTVNDNSSVLLDDLSQGDSLGWWQAFRAGYMSTYGRNTVFSLVAANAAFSVVAINAISSIGSINSVLSFGSINSALSLFSANSLLSIGCNGKVMEICYP